MRHLEYRLQGVVGAAITSFSLTDHHRWNKNDIKSIFCRSPSDGNLSM